MHSIIINYVLISPILLWKHVRSLRNQKSWADISQKWVQYIACCILLWQVITRFFSISNAFLWIKLKRCLTKSQIFRNLALPYLTKRFLKWNLEWVQSVCVGQDHWVATFSKICLSHKANFSLVLLIKVLLIKEKACSW